MPIYTTFGSLQPSLGALYLWSGLMRKTSLTSGLPSTVSHMIIEAFLIL